MKSRFLQGRLLHFCRFISFGRGHPFGFFCDGQHCLVLYHSAGRSRSASPLFSIYVTSPNIFQRRRVNNLDRSPGCSSVVCFTSCEKGIKNESSRLAGAATSRACCPRCEFMAHFISRPVSGSAFVWYSIPGHSGVRHNCNPISRLRFRAASRLPGRRDILPFRSKLVLSLSIFHRFDDARTVTGLL